MQANQYPKILILPFNILDSETRVEALGVEIAAISCLAFCMRKRTGIVGGKVEEVRAISKVYYPLVCIPWDEGCLISDGLGFINFTFIDRIVPDMLPFIESLKKNSIVLKNFIETLDYGASLFSKLIESNLKRYQIDYLIGEKNLLNAIASLYNKLMPIDEEKPKLIRPKLQMDHLKILTENVSEILNRLRVELSMLKYTLRVLEVEVNNHLKMLSRESSLVAREYKRRENEYEAEINKRTRLLNEKMLREINKVEEKYKKKIRVLLREKERIEKELLRNRTLLEKRLRGGDKNRYRSARSKVELYLSRVEDLERRSKELKRIIEGIEAERRNRIKEIEEKYNALIVAEREKINVIKESRNADIGKINEDIEKIKRSYSIIKESIMRIIGEKESLREEIKKCSLVINVDDIAVIGVPFYMIEYKGQKGIRVNFYPPSKITVQMMRNKVDKLSLESKMTLLLKPIGEPIRIISDTLMENWNRDLYLSSEVERIISEENLLSKNFMRYLRCGLEILRQNGWITNEEESAIIHFYEK